MISAENSHKWTKKKHLIDVCREKYRCACKLFVINIHSRFAVFMRFIRCFRFPLYNQNLYFSFQNELKAEKKTQPNVKKTTMQVFLRTQR